MHDADTLFDAGRFDAALKKYDALTRSVSDERQFAHALFPAVAYETHLAEICFDLVK